MCSSAWVNKETRGKKVSLPDLKFNKSHSVWYEMHREEAEKIRANKKSTRLLRHKLNVGSYKQESERLGAPELNHSLFRYSQIIVCNPTHRCKELLRDLVTVIRIGPCDRTPCTTNTDRAHKAASSSKTARDHSVAGGYMDPCLILFIED